MPKIPLVEIVRGLKTSDETFMLINEFSETLDKTAVEVYEYPGYITTRVIVPMINEAMYILMAWMETLFRELGESKYRPCPLLRKLVRAGHLGVKSGKGFFEYPNS